MGFLDATGITRLVTDLKNRFAPKSEFEQLQAQVETKQDELVSGTSIKTINNESLLGSGNIETFHGRIIKTSLPAAGWSNSIQTIQVDGVTVNSNLIVLPWNGDADYYYANKIYVRTFSNNAISFGYMGTKPTYSTLIIIIIFE